MQQFALDLFFPAESAPDCMLVNADCLEVLRMCPDNSIDSIVTDPPYGLSFMGKRWDYDVPSTEVWAECLRVLKPGGHLLAFAGTRTQHRKAARQEGFLFLGIEREAQYVEIAKVRILSAQKAGA